MMLYNLVQSGVIAPSSGQRNPVPARRGMAEKPDPVGFFSYVNEDDTHEAGRLTQLHERLVGEIGVHIGGRFEIFLGRQDLKWGQKWRRRVNDSLDSSVFLLPVIAPRFFC